MSIMSDLILNLQKRIVAEMVTSIEDVTCLPPSNLKSFELVLQAVLELEHCLKI